MAESVKKRLLEYNKMRESKCLLEGKSETCWLRPQKKHFPQSNRASVENYKEEKQEVDSGRTSWIKITPPPKEKRHFPEKKHYGETQWLVFLAIILSCLAHNHTIHFYDQRNPAEVAFHFQMFKDNAIFG